jgi:hypothetical protein
VSNHRRIAPHNSRPDFKVSDRERTAKTIESFETKRLAYWRAGSAPGLGMIPDRAAHGRCLDDGIFKSRK